VTDDGERQDGDHDGRDALEGFDDESYVELSLPEGTVIRPAECGFVLPTGQYLRVYAHGVQEERPDGMPAGTPDGAHELMPRPQFDAVLARIAADDAAFDAHASPSFTTGHNIIVVLPETLAAMHDEELIELCELIWRRITEMEMVFELSGNAPLESEPVGTVIHHILDLTTAGPYGRATYPLS